ncbi:imelysin family protein [Neolewinella agarilytica]|uniref:Imelysin n=1 Tax=Neolewinella agarilytica TaxID=478744 RepID=A0A1H8Z0K7_9BACT|nr:imelysin family protein [Neolewinella agarilytica]SEP57861.1 Imelysin [Neolewinella agarilytica]
MRITSLAFLLLLFISACTTNNGDDDGPEPVAFDRQAMLANWADNLIAPAYEALEAALISLDLAAQVYEENPNSISRAQLESRFESAYLSWQRASPFSLGKAEEIRLRGQLNTYPTDVSLIEENLANLNGINLELPSQAAAQGLPALDYLLFSLSEDALNNSPAYRSYLKQLTSRMVSLTRIVRDDLAVNRDAYIQNDGNSATASIDRTVNDYIFYFEKFLRAGKVGIPAGVFSDDPLADRAESLYAGQSKALFLAGLNGSEQFFNNGLNDYLDALGVERSGELLSQQINDQFAAIKAAANSLNDNFSTQVENDNTAMLQLYDELQKQVVFLKVDMLQALSINVDYVDADGD